MTYYSNLATLDILTSNWQPRTTIQTNWLLTPGGSLISQHAMGQGGKLEDNMLPYVCACVSLNQV